MSPARQRARRRSGPALLALAFLLMLGQLQGAAHRLVHPLASRSCEVCALAHHPVALAVAPEPERPAVCEIGEVPIAAFRSEPFVALAPSTERAPPPLSA